MSWRDRLRRAAWGGVEFYFARVRDERGHRISVFNPIDAPPSVQRLGETIRRFEIEGYFLSADPHAESERLAALVTAGGVYDFAHPYLGEFRTTAKTYRAHDDKNAGGYIQFSLELLVVADPPALRAITLSEDDSIAGARAAARELGAAALAQAAESLAADEGDIRPAAAEVTALTQTIAEEPLTVEDIIAFAGNAESGLPINRLWAAAGGDELLAALAAISLPVRGGLLNGAAWLPAIKRRVSSRTGATQYTALAGALTSTLGSAGIDEVFATQSQAENFRAEFVAESISAADEITDAPLRAALRKATTAADNVITRESPSLPRLVRYERLDGFAATAPRLAYRAQGGGFELRDQVDAMLKNNSVRHPLLLPDVVHVVVA